MKTKILMFIAAGVCGLWLPVSRGFSQGSLTPPGAPAPTMKTLAQIEPRTPISSAPYTISAPGSYYLTTNVTTAVSNAIVINASGVTLDLNGFTIFSTVPNAAKGGAAILLGDLLSDITLFNGHIRGGVTQSGSTYSGSGFGYGIYNNSDNQPANVRVFNVTVTGCLYDGINFNEGGASSTVVESCIVQTVGGYGIEVGTVRGSTASGGLMGISANTVSDSYGFSTDGGYGGISASEAINSQGFAQLSGVGLSASEAINCSGFTTSTGDALYANVANNCYAYNGGSGSGLVATTAINCSGTANGGGNGLYASTTATDCYGSSSSGFALAAQVAMGCYGVSSSSYGLYAQSAANCTGISGSSFGLYASEIATGCYGTTTTGSIGLSTYLANSCIGTKGIAATYSVSTTYKYNMP